MSHSPSTFRGEPSGDGAIWDDSATLHQRDDGGLLSGFRSIRRGSLIDLVRQVMTLPEPERRAYVIERAGDHRLDWAEIAALAARPDFPG
ncbi:MAG: hypothetical protein KGL44_03995 [Sphingomonadales bacterium]|nr:hypothetical protein [Sphingomonadales bacterium]